MDKAFAEALPPGDCCLNFNCDFVSSFAVDKSINNTLKNSQWTSIAPVHYSPHSTIKVVPTSRMEERLPQPFSLPLNSDSEKNLATDLQDKLLLKQQKSKSCSKSKVKNGMKLGTTDVEVHCSCVQSKSSNSLSNSNSTLDRNVKQINNSKENFSECLEHNCSSRVMSHSPLSSHKSIKNNSSVCFSNSISNVDAKSEHSQTDQHVCNGYSISEENSTNSIEIISDLSISSDKSIEDSSLSYVEEIARRRNISSGSSQSANPESEDFSLSNSSKIPDNSLSSLPPSVSAEENSHLEIEYVNYEDEHQMGAIMRLIQKDLSEPYSIYTYRYFIHNWPRLCFLAMHGEAVVGAIVCKLDVHKKSQLRGYIAMLVVDHQYRKKRIGSNLVLRAIRRMALDNADEVVLETEITYKPALQLYENLGFVRDKRLFRYYLNGVDALRLKLWLR